MRKCLTVVLCGFALLTCQQKPAAPAPTAAKTRVQPSDVRNAKVSEVIAPAPQFVDHVVLGTELRQDGTVAVENPVVPAGKPIYLTLFLRESPPGLQTSAVWMDKNKKQLRTQRKVMNGAKVTTFAFADPKAKPGRYKVVAYWGGNIATEREFEVLAGQKAKRKKG
jgi:hypothetical protein